MFFQLSFQSNASQVSVRLEVAPPAKLHLLKVAVVQIVKVEHYWFENSENIISDHHPLLQSKTAPFFHFWNSQKNPKFKKNIYSASNDLVLWINVKTVSIDYRLYNAYIWGKCNLQKWEASKRSRFNFYIFKKVFQSWPKSGSKMKYHTFSISWKTWVSLGEDLGQLPSRLQCSQAGLSRTRLQFWKSGRGTLSTS